MQQPLVPDPLESEEQWVRFHHEDVGGLSDAELWRELWRVQDALAWLDNAPDWLRERLSVLMQESDRRAGRRRR